MSDIHDCQETANESTVDDNDMSASQSKNPPDATNVIIAALAAIFGH